MLMRSLFCVRFVFAQHNGQVTHQKLADTWNMNQPPRPAGMVAGDQAHQRCSAGFLDAGGPVDAVGAGDVEKRFPKHVLRGVAVGACVQVAGEIAADVVLPQSGFVPSKGPQPDGVAEHHQAAGAGDAQHFIPHIPGIGHVLGDVGGIHNVKGGVGKGQRVAGAADASGNLNVRGGHFADIGFDGDVGATARGECFGEKAGASANVENPRVVQGSGGCAADHAVRVEGGDELRGVFGEVAVEVRGVALLVAEAAQQKQRATEGGHCAGAPQGKMAERHGSMLNNR